MNEYKPPEETELAQLRAEVARLREARRSDAGEIGRMRVVFGDAHTKLQAALDGVAEILGRRVGELVDDAARRVVAERDQAKMELAEAVEDWKRELDIMRDVRVERDDLRAKFAAAMQTIEAAAEEPWRKVAQEVFDLLSSQKREATPNAVVALARWKSGQVVDLQVERDAALKRAEAAEKDLGQARYSLEHMSLSAASWEREAKDRGEQRERAVIRAEAAEKRMHDLESQLADERSKRESAERALAEMMARAEAAERERDEARWEARVEVWELVTLRDQMLEAEEYADETNHAAEWAEAALTRCEHLERELAEEGAGKDGER